MSDIVLAFQITTLLIQRKICGELRIFEEHTIATPVSDAMDAHSQTKPCQAPVSNEMDISDPPAGEQVVMQLGDDAKDVDPMSKDAVDEKGGGGVSIESSTGISIENPRGAPIDSPREVPTESQEEANPPSPTGPGWGVEGEPDALSISAAQSGEDEAIQSAGTRASQSREDAAFDPPEDQATGSWKDSQVTANEDAFKPAVEPGSASYRPPEVLGPFPEWEFCLLSSQRNSEAYLLACNVIKQSIFDYGRTHFFETCNTWWDAACDVNLEFTGLNSVFGREGFATQNIAMSLQAQFLKAIDDLPHLRHRFAHPTNTSSSLGYVLQHISYARNMAKLLDDQSTVQKIDQLTNELKRQGEGVLQFIKNTKNLQGLPEGESWPRHCERLFEVISFVKAGYVESPAQRDEWERYYKLRRVSLFIREAAEDWLEKYLRPGVKR